MNPPAPQTTTSFIRLPRFVVCRIVSVLSPPATGIENRLEPIGDGADVEILFCVVARAPAELVAKRSLGEQARCAVDESTASPGSTRTPPPLRRTTSAARFSDGIAARSGRPAQR